MNRSIGLAIVAAGLFAGCQDNGLSELENLNLGTTPAILVEPTAIDFGVVADGNQEIRQFTVTNVGDATLTVDGINLVGDADFTILSQGLTFDLAPVDDDPTAVRVIDVAFSPLSDNTASAQALVLSNDEANPSVPVDLTGHSSAPYLVISPDPYDFGTQYVGIDCLDTQVLTMTNEGLEDLTITDIRYSDTTGLLDVIQSPGLPVTLSPGQQDQVIVEFDAWQSGSAAGTLSVTSNDPRGVVSANQTANTQYALTTTDNFTMPEELPVDIMFAIDQSCSMDTIVTNLQANFSTFISTIGTVTNDWRIGVLSTSDGCFLADSDNNNTNDITPRYITPSTPNYTTVFNNSVYTGTDGGGSWSEDLFTLSESAFNQMGSGCNAGFLRSGALLHVVFVSDEYEQSAGTTGGAAGRASTFHSRLVAAKGSASLVKTSGIICPGTSSSSCPSGSPDGSNHGYIDAIGLGGGVNLDITQNNWGASVEELATASLVALGRFELSQPADPSATEVLVNGSPWTGWHYDMATNSIVFDDLPPSGASITVNYGVAINCN